MIKHNVIAGTGGSGIEVADDGAAACSPSRTTSCRRRAARPSTARGRSRTVPRGDALRRSRASSTSPATRSTRRRGVGLAGGRQRGDPRRGDESARIAGNRLIAIGPRERFTNRVCASRSQCRSRGSTSLGNTLRRRGDRRTRLEPTPWIGLLIVADGRRRRGRRPRPFVMLGDIAVAKPRDRRLRAAHRDDRAPSSQHARVGDVARARQRHGRPALGRAAGRSSPARGCASSRRTASRAAPNRRPRVAHPLAGARSCRPTTCAGNSDAAVLEIVVQERTAPVLGNLRNGPITINGAPLGRPVGAAQPGSARPRRIWRWRSSSSRESASSRSWRSARTAPSSPPPSASARWPRSSARTRTSRTSRTSRRLARRRAARCPGWRPSAARVADPVTEGVREIADALQALPAGAGRFAEARLPDASPRSRRRSLHRRCATWCSRESGGAERLERIAAAMRIERPRYERRRTVIESMAKVRDELVALADRLR